MNFPQKQTLQSLAEFLGCRFVGAPDHSVLGTNEIHCVREGELVFVNHPKYYDKALNSAATTILIDTETDCPEGKGLLISEDPFRDFNRINLHFGETSLFNAKNTEAQIGENCNIHPSVTIGKNVQIGNNCTLYPNVVIGNGTRIGDDCIIQSGTVLGGDAFYYRKKDGKFERLESVGSVHIGNGVQIGNLCTIDRGVTDITSIGDYSILDNQIQIGHDTKIGKRCLIASQAGIAGCCTIGDDVSIWGQVGIASGLHIESGTVLMAKTGVNRSLKSGTYMGMIADDYKSFLRKEVKLKNLK